MSQDPLTEMVQFLHPQARIDLRHLSLEYLVGISGTQSGIDTLMRNEQIVQSVIDNTSDKTEEISKNTIVLLVNFSSTPRGATELLKYKPANAKNIVDLLIGYVLDPQNKNADGACMILTNITRKQDELDVCYDTFLLHLNDLLNAYVNTEYNKNGSKLNYLGATFSNLSSNQRIQKWLTEENPHIPLIKLLPFCNYDKCYIRRGGAASLLKNLSLNYELHEFLLSTDLDLLTYLLNPLMGNEEYDDDEMDSLPLALQYLPKEKRREPVDDVRMLLLESLNLLCSKKPSREILRQNGVYYVLREYHKWEKDPKIRLICENVVDILIQRENEVGAEDLSAVEVPDDLKEKFTKMDEDYLKDE